MLMGRSKTQKRATLQLSRTALSELYVTTTYHN